MFNIEDFKAQTDRGSFAKPSNFTALFSKPNPSSATASRDLMVRISAVTLPGRTVLTHDTFTYGKPTPMAVASNIDDISCTVYLSEDYSEKEYFETWIDSIVGPYATVNADTNSMWDISYFDDYKGTLDIYNFDDIGGTTYHIQCIDLFPVGITAIQLDWEQGNAIAKLDVSFKYKRFRRFV